MKRLIALLVAVAAVAAAVAVPAFAATKTVRVGPNISFGPSKLSLHRGDTVKFRWTGSLPHDVVITKGPQKGRISKIRKRGTVFHRFTKAGTYTIFCTIHRPNMKLIVRVR